MITVGFHQTLTFWRAKIRHPRKVRERAPYAIYVSVTARSSGDMVKQLQCGLAPNSRLQSKSRVNSSTLIMTRFKKRKKSPGKFFLRSVSNAEFHLLNLENVIVLNVLKSPQKQFFQFFFFFFLTLSFYVLNKQMTADISYNYFTL